MNKYLLKKEIEIEIDYMSCFHSKYHAMMSFRWIACSRCSTLHKHKKFQIMICLMFGLDYIESQPHPAIWVYWMKFVFVPNVTNDGADGAVSLNRLTECYHVALEWTDDFIGTRFSRLSPCVWPRWHHKLEMKS